MRKKHVRKISSPHLLSDHTHYLLLTNALTWLVPQDFRLKAVENGPGAASSAVLNV